MSLWHNREMASNKSNGHTSLFALISHEAEEWGGEESHGECGQTSARGSVSVQRVKREARLLLYTVHISLICHRQPLTPSIGRDRNTAPPKLSGSFYTMHVNWKSKKCCAVEFPCSVILNCSLPQNSEIFGNKIWWVVQNVSFSPGNMLFMWYFKSLSNATS